MDLRLPAAERKSAALQYIDRLRREYGLRADRVVFINNEEIVVIVRPELLVQVCSHLAETFGGVLTTMVGTDEREAGAAFALYYTFSLDREGLFITVQTRLPADKPEFPSVTPDNPAAQWYEREVKDLLGLIPTGHPDPRRLVLHDNWPEGLYPLRRDFPKDFRPQNSGDSHFQFSRIAGEGIFEVPVGPIHAGIIEPGHFRFSAMGEAVIHLEARLFYTHRGLEKTAEGMSFDQGVYLVERTCGACAVSHAVAYCEAVEKLAEVEAPPRARYLRTLLLELERLYNHVGDVGNICAGVGLAFGTSQCGRLKESLLRFNEGLTGNRFLRGMCRPGGVSRDLEPAQAEELRKLLQQLEQEFREVSGIILEHDFFLNRAGGTGVLPKETALDLGVVGPAARASGVDRDIRRDHPHAAYAELNFKVPVLQAGDVLARVKIRVIEAFESINLLRQALSHLNALPQPGAAQAGVSRTGAAASQPDAGLAVPVGHVEPYHHALGCTESPRGENVHWVMSGPDNTIFRLRIRSASYCNWPAVPLTVPGNIVPDFPLINKSFELCYSCLDR